VLAVHGTSAHLRAAISREGLKAPFDGQGISLVPIDDQRYVLAAAAASLRAYRRHEGGDWTEGKGLLVTVELSGLQGFPQVFNFDLRPPIIIVAESISARRIRDMREVVLPLPPRGSFFDVTAGMARTADDAHHGGDVDRLLARGQLVRL
jgi:hypothetical protein